MKLKNKTALLLIALFMGLNPLFSQTHKSGRFENIAFPTGRYVPFGYLDNPAHSFINRSGIIRSVPPAGMGYWATSLPWSYAWRIPRPINYLSFFHLAFSINGKSLITSDDYQQYQCNLYSAYHTKNILQYNWEIDSMNFSASYYPAGENNLICKLEINNSSGKTQQVTIHTTHEYGYIESHWWGSSGVTSNFNNDLHAFVDKIWEYGDVFIIGGDIPPIAVMSTSDEKEWHNRIRQNDRFSNKGKSIEFNKEPALYSMQSYSMDIAPLSSKIYTFVMSRGTNQSNATTSYKSTLEKSDMILDSLLISDNHFYANAPRLEGDWPQTWKNGWVYDFETLRMTVRPPTGIYKHPWDGMQIYSPRAVLGETAMDMLCLSYTDPDLAKQVLFGVFADSPAANVPCSREDGSMNMISAGGDECGTSPVWGLPFSVIYSVYKRTGDKVWLKSMYPYMKSFVEWWLANRTDKEGWFHCNNSWESGQDGSLRFTFEGSSEGDVSDFVRTVDVEAAMADAMNVLSKIAPLTGYDADADKWAVMAKDRAERMRTMYKDGWFRDVDGRNGQPIMLDTYGDVMMLLPLTTGLATQQQIKEIAPRLPAFIEGDKTLVWPPGIFFFTEAMRRTAGYTHLGAELIVSTGNRIYERMSTPQISATGRSLPHLPGKYNYRIPGSSNEFWPINLEKSNYGGAENYGWGATLPAMTIRSLFGFTESDRENEFYLAPTIPDNLLSSGKKFGISNLCYQNHRFTIMCLIEKNQLTIDVTCTSDNPGNFAVKNNFGKIIGRSSGNAICRVKGKNGECYTIQIL